MVTGKIKHPLLNPESRHYDRGEKTGIEQLEERHTVNQVINWCECTIFSYSVRKEHKGEQESDERKIETFRKYKNLLCDMANEWHTGNLSVSEAYEWAGIEMDYKLEEEQ